MELEGNFDYLLSAMSPMGSLYLVQEFVAYNW